MELDGGGWTLVGRSVASGSGNIGWGTANGYPSDDRATFSMDVLGLGPAFSELAFGQRGAGKTWLITYKHVAATHDFPAAFSSSALEMGQPLVLAGGCSPGANSMFRFVGFTSRTEVFFVRDQGNNSGTFGLKNNRWESNSSDCPEGGDIDDSDGMLMLR